MRKLLCLSLVVLILVLSGCSATSNQVGAAESEDASAPVEQSVEEEADVEEVAEEAEEEAVAEEPAAESSEEEVAVEEEELLVPTTKDTPLKIAYVPNVMNTHYDMVLSGIKEDIDRRGGESFAELLIQAPSNNTTSIQEQADILEAFIEQDVDAILLATESEEAQLPYMKKAAEAGIPVFMFNMAELLDDNPYYVTMVGYDQEEAGKLIGEWAVEYFGDEPTKVAILEGFPGVVNTMRLEGFKSVIADKPNFEIVASQVADWTRAQGQTVTENILTANPDINFLFGLYDEMSLGAITAIKERGLMDQIVVAGYDNTKDAYASIQAGEMMVTVDTAAKEMGINLIKAVNDFCIDGKELPHIINSNLVVYDQSNIETFNPENYIYVEREPEVE